jgi:hypothetical protein
VYSPTVKCGLPRCIFCVLPTWRLLECMNREVARYYSLARRVGSLTRASGLLEEDTSVEVYSWVWEAEEGKRMVWDRAGDAVPTH